MDVLTILFFMMVYFLLSLGFVWFVEHKTANQTYRRLALAFVILLPTWDAILGFIVYYPACLLVPKVAIYETAETDSIYFEGLHNYLFMLERRYRNITDDELTQIGSIEGVCHSGYAFAEALVVEKHTITPETRESIPPVVYKCIPLPTDKERPAFKRTSCAVVREPTSRYVVKVRTYNVGTAEVNLKKIYDRSTGKLMAEYNRANRWSYAGLFGIPFFNWLDWGWGSKESGSKHCPPSTQEYEAFEYEVLKPKSGS